MKRTVNFIIIFSLLAFISGCALFDKSIGQDTIKIGDGKLFGIGLETGIKDLLTLIPDKIASCNKDNQITPNCLIAIADGVVCAQSTITPEDKAIKDALAELDFVTDSEEYKCCKGVGIAGTLIYNKLGGNGITTIMGLIK